MNKYWSRSRYLNFFIKKFEIWHFDLNWLYKEEINENIRLRKLRSVLLLQVHINTMPLLLLVFCTVTSCYTFRYTFYTFLYCNMSLSYTFKSTYIIIKACGPWSPYIGRQLSSYFRPQTSKFRLYSWHFRHRNLDFKLAVFTINVCAHRPKPPFSELF